jgi:hypothetical protein
MSLLLNDRVALATDRTGVNTPETMFPDSGPIDTRFFRNRQFMSPARGSTQGCPSFPTGAIDSHNGDRFLPECCGRIATEW